MAPRLEEKKKTKYKVMKVSGLFGTFSYSKTEEDIKFTMRETLNSWTVNDIHWIYFPRTAEKMQ